MTGLAKYAPRIMNSIMTVVFGYLFPQAQAFKVLRLGQFLLSLASTHIFSCSQTPLSLSVFPLHRFGSTVYHNGKNMETGA